MLIILICPLNFCAYVLSYHIMSNKYPYLSYTSKTSQFILGLGLGDAWAKTG